MSSVRVLDRAARLRQLLQFDDLLDRVTGSYSLNGGTTVHSFAPVAWSFSGGQFALVSSATAAIPEPGTAALVALGLSVLAGSRRRR